MDTISSSPLNNIANNFLVCLADFPSNLSPNQIDVPVHEQAIVLAGLATLHSLIEKIYVHFSLLIPENKHWKDREYCYQAIEGPVKLLYILGAFGNLILSPEGCQLKISCEVLEPAIKKYGCHETAKSFEVLETVGVKLAYIDEIGLPVRDSDKKCAAVALSYPLHNEPLLQALVYYSRRLPEKKTGRKEKGVIFEVFFRADFRPLLPGYSFHIPHLPATEEEVTRTFQPKILKVWKALAGFMADRYPQYNSYYRVPGPRSRRWVVDYSTKDNDYGSWSIFIDEGGLSVRIVMNEGTVNNMIDHIAELSPDFQENYLNAVACKDCSHCGKHIFFTHKDHVHKLCKIPWYISPDLELDDLPDIERLIDFRLATSQ